MSPDQRLAALLSESPDHASARESSLFTEINGGRPIVVFGAGNLGRRVARELVSLGFPLLCFSDNNPALWGTWVEGLPVLSPAEAVGLHRAGATFLVGVWNPDHAGVQTILDQLRCADCRSVMPFTALFWKLPDSFLPYYLWDLPSRLLLQREEILAAYRLFSEPECREQFVRQVEFRCTGDFRALTQPELKSQYFPDSLYRFLDAEVFVDCGAYDGDTIRAFLQKTHGRFRKIFAFEADPENFRRLGEFVEQLGFPDDKVRKACAAVYDQAGKLRFAASGLSSASITSEGGQEVDAVSLDEYLKDEQPTLIKMDIEGAELAALNGAQTLIAACQPVMAICVYHRQDHLWRIPLWLKRHMPGARFYLKAHCVDGFELVCYAVPADRL